MSMLDRFLKYVAIDTTADSSRKTTPTSEGQIKLAKMLVKELQKLNVKVYHDEKHGYVYATLKGKKDLPRLGFIAHLDTSEECSGKDIKPNIIYNYDGKDIILNTNVILSPNVYLELKNYVGKTLITSDGKTILGADDKAGITEIMFMLEYFANSKEEHGDILVCFTPDEEIGKGILHLDRKRFNPDFAYTVDGSSLGEFSYETFNSATATIKIKGIRTHCGSAKGKMINASRIAMIINAMLPLEIPENTDNYEGFYHLREINGNVENATVIYLISDFNKERFKSRKQLLTKIIKNLNKEYHNCIELEIVDEYHNMLEVFQNESDLIGHTLIAISKAEITPKVIPDRGSTDGNALSFNGLSCPNLGSGAHNYHSVYEYVCLEDMQKIGDLLIQIVRHFAAIKK